MNLITGLTGAGLGLVYGLVNYKKKKKLYKSEMLNLWKLAPTVALSGVAGFLVGVEGDVVNQVTVASAVSSLTALGADRLIEQVVKLVKTYF